MNALAGESPTLPGLREWRVMKTGDQCSENASQEIPSIPEPDVIDEFPEEKPAAAESSSSGGDSQARHWAALLTGDAALEECTIESAQEQLMEWLLHFSGGFPKDVSGFPEVFQTARFWSEVKSIEIPLRLLKTVFGNLQSGKSSCCNAMEHIERTFGRQEDRLLKWKRAMENFAGLIRWIPAFKSSAEYIQASFPLGRQNLDQLRETLLQSISEPHRFLESGTRIEFEERFLEFKKNYIDCYFVLHEEALHVISGLKKDEVKIDPVLLRNLDLLSGLQHTDKSYLNRVKLLARWIQHNQCHLPLHQILETYPRCYCNFNPGIHQQPGASAAQINSIIQEGLEYFRTILRRCGHLIMEEVKAHPIDDHTLEQITAALSDGPMIPLKAHTIKILNRIIGKNSAQFQAEIRKLSIKTAN